MFVNDEEGNKRLSSLDNLINRLNGQKNIKGLKIKKIHNGGRPKDRENDTDDERAEIGIASLIHGPTKAAEEYDTTISRASLLSKGIATHSNGPKEELVNKVIDKKEAIHQKALDIICGALESIDDKIDKVSKPKDLAFIASSMAKVAERTSPKNSNNDNGPKVQVVVYAPRVRDSSEYEVVEG